MAAMAAGAVGDALGLVGAVVVDVEMRFGDVDSDEPVGYGHGACPCGARSVGAASCNCSGLLRGAGTEPACGLYDQGPNGLPPTSSSQIPNTQGPRPPSQGARLKTSLRSPAAGSALAATTDEGRKSRNTAPPPGSRQSSPSPCCRRSVACRRCASCRPRKPRSPTSPSATRCSTAAAVRSRAAGRAGAHQAEVPAGPGEPAPACGGGRQGYPSASPRCSAAAASIWQRCARRPRCPRRPTSCAPWPRRWVRSAASRYGVARRAGDRGATSRRSRSEGKLARHRVLHFATHGLLAGETRGDPQRQGRAGADADPAQGRPRRPSWSRTTACSPPPRWRSSSSTPTGWCSPPATRRPATSGDAEALSGLARAFFYAKARALLVSHWYVASDAAVKLTTGAFARAQPPAPRIGRAEALRRSMATLITKGTPHEAHPSHLGAVRAGRRGRALARG